MSIGSNIRKLRKSKNIKGIELSKNIGVSKTTIWYWENDLKEPKVENLISLADFFGITIDYLVGRDKKCQK